MPPGLPVHITIIFLATVVLTFIFLCFALNRKKPVMLLIISWLAITGLLAYKGIFLKTGTIPPPFFLAVLPPLLFILIIVYSRRTQGLIQSADLRLLTLLHVVRIPVELVLFWLAGEKLVPELMTFEGRNFDIFSGITAPVMYVVCFSGKTVKHKGLLITWNFICLTLLINIVVHAALSAPFPFQQFAFEQPNVAVLAFPFVWLPAFIVMSVLLSHLVVLKRLMNP